MGHFLQMHFFTFSCVSATDNLHPLLFNKTDALDAKYVFRRKRGRAFTLQIQQILLVRLEGSWLRPTRIQRFLQTAFYLEKVVFSSAESTIETM
jgi:hypothetical protein